MGLRGPLRNPDSTRGVREGTRATATMAETPVVPAGLSKSAARLFVSLVRDLQAAGVPVKQVDAHAIGQAASCLSESKLWARREKRTRGLEEKLSCSREARRYARDSRDWLAMIGGSPQSRARMNIKTPPPKTTRTVLSIIAAQKERG